jgi:hypothetical protein
MATLIPSIPTTQLIGTEAIPGTPVIKACESFAHSLTRSRQKTTPTGPFVSNMRPTTRWYGQP